MKTTLKKLIPLALVLLAGVSAFGQRYIPSPFNTNTPAAVSNVVINISDQRTARLLTQTNTYTGSNTFSAAFVGSAAATAVVGDNWYPGVTNANVLGTSAAGKVQAGTVDTNNITLGFYQLLWAGGGNTYWLTNAAGVASIYAPYSLLVSNLTVAGNAIYADAYVNNLYATTGVYADGYFKNAFFPLTNSPLLATDGNGQIVATNTLSAAQLTSGTNAATIGTSTTGLGFVQTSTAGSNVFKGKVGIGTEKPSDLLTLSKDSESDETLLRLTPSINSTSRGYKRGMGFYSVPTGQDGAFIVGGIYSVWDGNAYGTERLTLQSTSGTSQSLINVLTLKAGNVGIGTTTPAARLHVTNTAAGYAMKVDSFGSANSLVVTNGNVGIGTNSPQAALHVNGGILGEGAFHINQRALINSGARALSQGSGVTIFTLTGYTNSFVSGRIEYAIYCQSAGLEVQALSGVVAYAAVNTNGVWASLIIDGGSEVLAATSGTLTNVWSMAGDARGAGWNRTNVTISAAAGSSLTPAAGQFYMRWQVQQNSTNNITAH